LFNDAIVKSQKTVILRCQQVQYSQSSVLGID